MTSSGTSTNAGQFFLLLSMVGAIAAVAFARDTHPVALLLLSGAVVAAGLVGLAFHRALSEFFRVGGAPPPLTPRVHEDLEREKALTLRSIKELEFDHAMRKISDADFAEIGARLRARALTIMQDLERAPAAFAPAVKAVTVEETPAPAVHARACPACQSDNDTTARFCNQCGAKL